MTQVEIVKLGGPGGELARLLAEISMRVFKQDWNCDIEWDVRGAIDDRSFKLSGVDTRLDPGEGMLTPGEIARLLELRAELEDGWVLLDGLRPERRDLGFLRVVSAQEWASVIGTDKYRLGRYAVAG